MRNTKLAQFGGRYHAENVLVVSIGKTYEELTLSMERCLGGILAATCSVTLSLPFQQPSELDGPSTNPISSGLPSVLCEQIVLLRP